MTSRPDRAPRRRILSGLSLAALVAAAAGVAGVVSAQDPSEPPTVPVIASPLGQPKDFPRTPAEDEVWQLYQDDKLLTARRKVEALLEDEPDSLVGRYVFAQVLRRAEGNLPKAIKQIGRARELYEVRYKPTVVNLADTPWLLHREILYAAQQIAGELEHHDYHDSLYDPRLRLGHPKAGDRVNSQRGTRAERSV